MRHAEGQMCLHKGSTRVRWTTVSDQIESNGNRVWTTTSHPVPGKMSADTDEACIRALGEFGRWQLRGILLMALVKVPAAWQMASILFTAPSPGEFWCARPRELLNWDDQEWRELVHPNTSAVSGKTHIFIYLLEFLLL